MLAKNVNDNAALSGGLRCLLVLREQARSYSARCQLLIRLFVSQPHRLKTTKLTAMVINK